jgi:hypothetical protein
MIAEIVIPIYAYGVLDMRVGIFSVRNTSLWYWSYLALILHVRTE